MAWRFEPGEGLRPAFRRVATEEIVKVHAGLTAAHGDRDKAIHEARQGFKRLRALVRLAKPALAKTFTGENRRWRDAGRLLSRSRDTTVLLQSFDKLVAGCRAELPSDAVERLRNCIATDGAVAPTSEMEASVGQVLDLLDEAEARIGRLDWPSDTETVFRGLRKSQAQLRSNWEEARKSSAPDALHRWRKRVKDQSAQLRLFRRVMPDGLRVLRNDEKETAELLGEEHDFWLLSKRLAVEPATPDAAGVRDLLIEEIEDRRSALRRKAFKQGEKFSSKKASVFAQTLCDAWDKASARAARASHRKRPAAG